MAGTPAGAATPERRLPDPGSISETDPALMSALSAAALLHGPALAALGQVGAFVAPLLVASDLPNYWALYIYLGVVTAASFALARARMWRWLVVTAVVLIGQLLSVSVGSFLSGHDVATSVWTGLSLAQLGEFSFIIAGLGAATGAIGPALLPIIVAVAVLTTFLTPILIRHADRIAAEVDRRLPHRVQTFATLYGSWLEARRKAPLRRA